jgi:hypothetical protein
VGRMRCRGDSKHNQWIRSYRIVSYRIVSKCMSHQLIIGQMTERLTITAIDSGAISGCSCIRDSPWRNMIEYAFRRLAGGTLACGDQTIDIFFIPKMVKIGFNVLSRNSYASSINTATRQYQVDPQLNESVERHQAPPKPIKWCCEVTGSSSDWESTIDDC